MTGITRLTLVTQTDSEVQVGILTRKFMDITCESQNQHALQVFAGWLRENLNRLENQ